MKVLHVIPSLAVSGGGPPWVLAAVARAEMAAGYEVEVATLAERAGAQETALPEGTTVHRFAPVGPRRWERSPAMAGWLADNIQRFDGIRVHSVFSWTSSVALKLARVAGRRVVLMPHGALMRRAVRPWQVWKALWLRDSRDDLKSTGARLHALCEAELERSAWCRVPGFSLAPTWPLRPPSGAVPARRDGGYVLFLGRIHPVKRLEILLHAVAIVPAARIVVAGSGPEPYLGRIRRLALRLGLGERVTWAGHVGHDAKKRLLDGALALAMPSRFESFGVAALEALAAGVPAIVTPEVGVSRTVSDSGAGEVVPGTVDEWGAALGSLWLDRGCWCDRAEAAWAWSSTIPTAGQFAERLSTASWG